MLLSLSMASYPIFKTMLAYAVFPVIGFQKLIVENDFTKPVPFAIVFHLLL